MPCLLLVDDDPSILAFVEALLDRAGYEVVTARDGDAACSLATERAFDYAVVDYDIPGPNGLEVLRTISERSPCCAGVLASGALDLQIAMRAVNDGSVAHVLSKPYRRRDLLDALAAAAAHRPGTPAEAPNRRAEREALAMCFADDLLALAVQPIFRAADGQVAAYEALLRCNHPLLKGPLPVLAAAERTDRIHELGERVAQLARGWADRIPLPQRLFVNLHPLQLADPEALVASLEPLQIHAPRIVLEITERSRLDDVGTWRRSTQELLDRGFSLAIDDLGSGFSTMSILAEVKPAVVKVDQSIIRGIDVDSHKQRLLELIVQFAKATESELVAEGIETADEALTAIACGSELLQGYHFGRPAFELVRSRWERAS